MEDVTILETNNKKYNIKDKTAREEINIIKNNPPVFNVIIEKDGFGNFISNYNDNDINNARNSGKIVQAKYYDDVTGQTYTYYYSTMESDRRPTFIRTFIEGNKIIQVLATIGFDKKVEINRNEVDVNLLIEPVNNEVDLLTGEISDAKNDIGLLNTTDEQIKSQITNLYDTKQDKINDTGWIDIPLENSVTVGSVSKKAQYRIIGNICYLSGDISNVKKGIQFGKLPIKLNSYHYFISCFSGLGYSRILVANDGRLIFEWASDNNYSKSWYSIDTSFIIN